MNKRLLTFALAASCALPLSAQTTDTPAYVEEAPIEGVYEPDEEEKAQKAVVYNTATPTDAQWQRQTSGKEFGYKDEEEYAPPKDPPKKEKPYEDPWFVKAIDGLLRFLSSTAGAVLLWSVLGLLAVYIIYQIIAGNGRLFARRDRKRPVEDGQELSREDLLGSNWEERLDRALAAGDTREAIRYSYLLLLQLLQQRELIAFRNDKTNTDYYRELGQTGADLRPSFRQLSRQYEFAWYGNYLPDGDTFGAYMQAFDSIKNRLQGS